MYDSVTVHMEAPPEKIFGLVSDITNTGKFSPETFEAEWLEGATEPDVGTKFRGHVKRNGRGPTYWTKCRIITCDPGREFAFTVVGPGDKPINTWRYEFEQSGEGTDVTESFELADSLPTKIYWKIAGRWRNRTNVDGMRATLERIKEVAEAEA